MLTVYRTTSVGMEYWDTEKKCIVIGEEGLQQIEPSTETVDFSQMTLKELKLYAQGNDIELPKTLNKKEAVIAKIMEQVK